MNIVKIVENLEIGDTFYESEYGTEKKLVVETQPERSFEGAWTWLATNERGNTVNYLVNENYLGYAPNIFIKEAQND